jgi:hypothetical protein
LVYSCTTILHFNNIVLHKGMEEMSKLGSEWRGEVDLDKGGVQLPVARHWHLARSDGALEAELTGLLITYEGGPNNRVMTQGKERSHVDTGGHSVAGNGIEIVGSKGHHLEHSVGSRHFIQRDEEPMLEVSMVVAHLDSIDDQFVNFILDANFLHPGS